MKTQLRITLNTNYESAGTKVCVDDLLPRLQAAGHRVARNDWNSYADYDVALFMSPDAQPQHAKQENPRIIAGIMDPKIATVALRRNIQAADFTLVSSLEQRDAVLPYNPRAVIYYMFPDIPARPKQHAARQPTIIGYHGNREHLVCFHPHISAALNRLGKNHQLEFWAVYNIKRHGRWTRGVPRQVPVRHIQWSPEVYERELAQADIGIVNNAIPYSRGIRHHLARPVIRYLRSQAYPYDQDDTIMRFKYSANPGRLYPFARLNVPVVADFTPTNGLLLGQDERGLLAHTEAGWHEALRQLIHDPALRQRLSDNLHRYIESTWSIDHNFVAFNEFLIREASRHTSGNTRNSSGTIGTM